MKLVNNNYKKTIYNKKKYLKMKILLMSLELMPNKFPRLIDSRNNFLNFDNKNKNV